MTNRITGRFALSLAVNLSQFAIVGKTPFASVGLTSPGQSCGNDGSICGGRFAMLKKCVFCGEEKPLFEFSPSKQHKSKLYPYCKACCSKKATDYRNRNIDVVRKKDRNRSKESKEKKRDRERTRYENNREEKKQYQREYNLLHPGSSRKHVAEYRQNIKISGSYTLKEWKELKEKYSYHCLCCGRQEPEIKLEADHVVPVMRGGKGIIDNIQPLCTRCNHRKFIKSTDYRNGQ